MTIKPAWLACLALLAGCGDVEPVQNAYENPAGDAAFVILTYNYGGAAGFVRVRTFVRSDGDTRPIATFSHFVPGRIRWTSDRSIQVCYSGVMDEGGRDNSVAVGEKAYVVAFRKNCELQSAEA